ncbi:MAG: TlpA family protein disulfide reductase [Planctomycetes bacterium]|nr:TlpA family protein disulfide reductase [Planctomycetota bacterium]
MSIPRSRSRFTRALSGLAIASVLPLAGPGCAGRSIALVNLTERGSHRQWVWPHFLYEQPTVLAFWSTNEMECLRNVPALQALEARRGSVQLVTVVTGRDRLEIDKWIREKRMRYPVLLDLDGYLARRLDVGRCPTFVYFSVEGKELERVEDVRLVRKWFDSERWIQLGEGIEPASARASPRDE